MTIGTGILLFVIGAILAFALQIEVDWIDIDMVGYLLMGAGALVVIIGIGLLASRRNAGTVRRTTVDPVTGESVQSEHTTLPGDGRV